MSPEKRVTAFYFTQFMTAGSSNAFAGIWFASIGLNPDQIGLISSTPIFVLLLLNIFVGRIADRAKDWRQVIIAGVVASALMSFGLLYVRSFWGILFFWTLAAIAQSSTVPVADAATLRLTTRRGTSFGNIRAWGTIGYVAAIFVTGLVVTWAGGSAFMPLFVGLALLRAATSAALPQFRSEEKQQAVHGAATKLSHMLRPWLFLPLLAWAMIFSSHLVLNAFQTLLWKQQGLPDSVSSGLLALGALSEAAMFFAFRSLASSYPPRNLLILSGVVSTLRWLAMAYSPNVYVLVPMQLLHSITFALGFLGCVNYITQWTSEDMSAEAQGFAVVLQQILAVIMFTVFGHLMALYGAGAYFASAAVAAAGTAVVLLSFRTTLPGAKVSN